MSAALKLHRASFTVTSYTTEEPTAEMLALQASRDACELAEAHLERLEELEGDLVQRLDEIDACRENVARAQALAFEALRVLAIVRDR